MNTAVKVARYLTATPLIAVGPWFIVAIDFVINALIVAGIPSQPGQQHYVGALAAIYIFVQVLSGIMIYRNLPAALALGVSRRNLYAGTALFIIAWAAVNAVGLTILQAVESATHGWGIAMHFFRVPYLFAGPWYLTWLTSFVGLVLMGAWGIWFGLVLRRWSLVGMLGFITAQVLVIALVIVIAARTDAWASIGHFFLTLTIEGLTGILAALAAVLLIGGFVTIRRATV